MRAETWVDMKDESKETRLVDWSEMWGLNWVLRMEGKMVGWWADAKVERWADCSGQLEVHSDKTLVDMKALLALMRVTMKDGLVHTMELTLECLMVGRSGAL